MIFPRRICDLGLSHKAVAVYCYLANRADKNGECYPSVRRIAEDLSIHKSTVFRAFKELEEQGLLEREARYHTQGGRRSSLYRIKGEITQAERGEKSTLKNLCGKSTSEKGGDINV